MYLYGHIPIHVYTDVKQHARNDTDVVDIHVYLLYKQRHTCTPLSLFARTSAQAVMAEAEYEDRTYYLHVDRVKKATEMKEKKREEEKQQKDAQRKAQVCTGEKHK